LLVVLAVLAHAIEVSQMAPETPKLGQAGFPQWVHYRPVGLVLVPLLVPHVRRRSEIVQDASLE